MDIGTALGRELGLSTTEINAVADWRATTDLSDDDKLVIELAEVLTMTPVTMPDGLKDRLDARFSETQIVELAHLIAWENCRARFNRAFGIEADGYTLP